MLHAALLLEIIGDEDILTTAQVSELVGKSPETVRRWCRKGYLQSLCPGHFRVTGAELKAFLAAKNRVRGELQNS